MKKRKLERYLSEYKCFPNRHGGKHDGWLSADGKRGTVIPRHTEIKPPIVRAICRDLGVPPPPEK